MRHFTDQEIDNAMKRAPSFIQDELALGEDIPVAIAGIAKKYGLHIDQLGTVAELNRNMFLGLVGPGEFLKELIAAGIPDANARGIMAEINQKIFIPLREQIRNAAPPPSPGATQGTVPHPTEASREGGRPVNVPMPKYYAPRPFESSGIVGPPPQSPKYPRAENELPAGLRFAQGAQAQRPTPPRPAVATPVPTPPPPNSLGAPTESPLRQALRAVTPPQNLPGALPPSPLPAPTQPSIPIRKPTDTDPYREPIE